MSYKVISPVVAIAPSGKSDDLGDANNGPRYFYDGAVIPDGFNDERCEELVKDKMLEKVEPAADPNKVPVKSASKADWVAFATDDARGESKLTAEEAEAMTRDDLAEKFKA